MSTYADNFTTLIVAGVQCDGQDGDCTKVLEREFPLAKPLPGPASGDRDDPTWAALRAHGEQVQVLAQGQGWLVNDQGEYCQDCALHAPCEDDEPVG
ncbi:hypothetical protein [Streptomyces luteireticuli]|uniref:hypothetical protein n=1 Tax=Streptomyces luteireticuli TaxID=173858 RepID=UPI0035591953